MARQIEYFLPCFLVVLTALCLGLVGVATYFYMQGPGGAYWTLMPATVTLPTSLTTTGTGATPPPPPVTLSLRPPACPLAVCELRDDIVAYCDDADATSLCIVDDLRPSCSLGTCAGDSERCAATAGYLLTFQCDCTCAIGGNDVRLTAAAQ